MRNNPAPVKAPKRLVRKHDPEYIQSGFIMAGSDAVLKAQFVECGEILSQPSLFLCHVIFPPHLFGKEVLGNFLTIRNGPSVIKG